MVRFHFCLSLLEGNGSCWSQCLSCEIPTSLLSMDAHPLPKTHSEGRWNKHQCLYDTETWIKGRKPNVENQYLNLQLQVKYRFSCNKSGQILKGIPNIPPLWTIFELQVIAVLPDLEWKKQPPQVTWCIGHRKHAHISVFSALIDVISNDLISAISKESHPLWPKVCNSTDTKLCGYKSYINKNWMGSPQKVSFYPSWSAKCAFARMNLIKQTLE